MVVFLLSPPSSVARVIKPKSPTVREWNPPNWGTSQQQIRMQHPKAYDQSGVCAGWRVPYQTFFFSLLSPHSPPLGYRCADGTLWLNVRTLLHPPSSPPPAFVLVRQEKLWLTPGRNPVAATIYREGTQSHLHLELMRNGSMGARVGGEPEKRREGYSPFLKKIHFLLGESHSFLSEWRKNEGRGKTVEDVTQIPPNPTHKDKKLSSKMKKLTQIEFNRLEYSWACSYPTFLLLPREHYQPSVPVTVSCAPRITQSLIKILQSCRIDPGASVIEEQCRTITLLLLQFVPLEGSLPWGLGMAEQDLIWVRRHLRIRRGRGRVVNTIMVGNNCNKAGETVWERFDWPPMGKRGWEDADEARIHNINSSWAAQSGTGNHMVYQRHQRCSRSNGTKKCRRAQKHPSGRQRVRRHCKTM